MSTYSKVVRTTVQNLNLKWVRPQRAGIIIYTVKNNVIYFGLGLDAKTHDLTDFGGHVVYAIDETAVNGAIREFDEETLRIFNPITADMISACPVIYDDRNLIIFVHLDLDPNDISQTFNQAYKRAICQQESPEVCGITWLNWKDFRTNINRYSNVSGNIFRRVQNFLHRAGDFSILL